MHITYHPNSSSLKAASKSPHIDTLSPEYPQLLYRTIHYGVNSGVSVVFEGG